MSSGRNAPLSRAEGRSYIGAVASSTEERNVLSAYSIHTCDGLRPWAGARSLTAPMYVTVPQKLYNGPKVGFWQSFRFPYKMGSGVAFYLWSNQR